MHATRTIATFYTLVVGWTAPLTAQGPCVQITTACKNAGFTLGGASGTRLQADCISPIMQGIAQPAAATRPLPQVAPKVVAACKARHPDFGQGKGPTSAAAAAIKPAPANAAQPLATPVPPSASSSAATTGNGMTPSTSSVTAGAASLQPGTAGTGGVQPDIEKAPKAPRVDSVPAPVSWPITCRIGRAPINFIGYANTTLGPRDTVFVNFSLSKGPGSSGLKPGQCAFEDRAVKATEPAQLCFTADTGVANPFFLIPPGSSLVNSPEATLIRSATEGPTSQMSFSVHKGMFFAPCWWIDDFYVLLKGTLRSPP